MQIYYITVMRIFLEFAENKKIIIIWMVLKIGFFFFLLLNLGWNVAWTCFCEIDIYLDDASSLQKASISSCSLLLCIVAGSLIWLAGSLSITLCLSLSWWNEPLGSCGEGSVLCSALPDKNWLPSLFCHCPCVSLT